jgi:hypothetical protein
MEQGGAIMNRIVKSSMVVTSALWVGVLFCLGFVVAPYLFALAAKNSPAVPNSGVAADLIGPLLYSSDVISLIVGGVLVLALVYLRRRGETPMGGRLFVSEIVVAIAVMCAALNYWWFFPRIKTIKEQLSLQYGAFHHADKSDPLFSAFNAMHQTSTALFVIGLTTALIALICMTQFSSRMKPSAP